MLQLIARQWSLSMNRKYPTLLNMLEASDLLMDRESLLIIYDQKKFLSYLFNIFIELSCFETTEK